MLERFLAKLLILWVCVVLPLESVAFGVRPTATAAVAATQASPHHGHQRHGGAHAHDAAVMKCCKTVDCPHCAKAGSHTRACASVCSAGLMPSVALDTASPVLPVAAHGEWPALVADLAPGHGSRLLRPPI